MKQEMEQQLQGTTHKEHISGEDPNMPRVLFQGPILRVQFVGNKFYETFASSTFVVLVVFTSIDEEADAAGAMG